MRVCFIHFVRAYISVATKILQWKLNLKVSVHHWRPGYYTYNLTHCRYMYMYNHALTSSTLMFSFALVSYKSIPICSENFCASSVCTTFFSGQSFLLPTMCDSVCVCVCVCMCMCTCTFMRYSHQTTHNTKYVIDDH